MALILSGSGLNPLSLTILPRYLTSSTRSCSFLLLNLMLRCLARSNVSLRVLSCSSVLGPATMMLSCTASTPGISEKLLSTIFCATSAAEEIPNGIRLNLYLPKGVLNMHR